MQPPRAKTEEDSNPSEAAVATDALIISDDEGVKTSKISSDSKLIQNISASENSNIKGSEVSFPPGSFVIDTIIEMKEGESIASKERALSLGIDADTVLPASPSIEISNSRNVDSKEEFEVKIPIEERSALSLSSDSYLIVFYRI